MFRYLYIFLAFNIFIHLEEYAPFFLSAICRAGRNISAHIKFYLLQCIEFDVDCLLFSLKDANVAVLELQLEVRERTSWVRDNIGPKGREDFRAKDGKDHLPSFRHIVG